MAIKWQSLGVSASNQTYRAFGYPDFAIFKYGDVYRLKEVTNPPYGDKRIISRGGYLEFDSIDAAKAAAELLASIHEYNHQSYIY